GNDYHVLEAVRFFKPRIIICEFNAVFGPERLITVPYDPGFVRSKKHYSNLYFGASLGAFAGLCDKRGYSLVGTNLAGTNAFFVRKDLINDKIEALTTSQAFTCSKMRESGNEDGELSYLSGDDRLKAIRGAQVINLETSEVELN